MSSKVSRRLTEGTAPEVSEHVYGPRLARDFPACFSHLVDINQAHLLMLRAQDLLPADEASQLAAALLEIDAQGAAAVPLDPALEDAYFNFEAHLMKRAGAHVGGTLHVARSRNDILATMDRLRVRQAVMNLVDGLSTARVSALKGANEYAGVVMPGYTHLQPAQPITFGFYLLGVADLLGRDIARLRKLQTDIDLCPLGACALAGTTFNIDRERAAALLGFAGVVPHTLDAVASRDFALELMSALAIMATGASRVAQDFYVWVTPEFNLVEFPDSVTGTSSIMPQKKNPIVLEYLKGKASQITGSLMAALGAVKGVNFTHTGDGNRESMRNVWEAADESLHILSMLDLVLRSARPHVDRMLERAQRDFGTATDLADMLVRRSGLSFRESHHVVGAVVRAAMDGGMTAAQITTAMVDDAAKDQLGRALQLAQSEISASLDPSASVAARNAGGGPGPESVRQRSLALLDQAAAASASDAARRERFAATHRQLKEAVRSLAGAARTIG